MKNEELGLRGFIYRISTVYLPYIYRVSTVYLPYIYRISTVPNSEEATKKLPARARSFFVEESKMAPFSRSHYSQILLRPGAKICWLPCSPFKVTDVAITSPVIRSIEMTGVLKYFCVIIITVLFKSAGRVACRLES